VLRNVGLAKLLGCPVVAPSLEFPLFEQDYREAAELVCQLPSTSGPRIGLHTGARPPARRWPAAHFASLADELVRRYNAQILLTGAPNESETISKVIACMRTQPVNLAGKTSLGGLAALIRQLDLFISNDTGPAHLAYALDTPSITIFGPADYRRWAPLQPFRHLIVRHPVPCSPCTYWECPFIDHPCLNQITSAQVMTVAENLLNNI
jgi:ADP-heptose:LPS heptosyltransferase